MFNLINRGELPASTENEFENLNSRLKGLWGVQHKDDGTHDLPASAIPGLDASIIISGTINAARLPTTVPSGVVWATAASAAPTGFLLCDGSAVSRTTYASLFSAIGTTYGVGDGSTTFNIPDLRQRFPLGKAASGTGSTLGSTGGAIDHTHVYTQVVSHTHTITDPGHVHSVTDPGHTHNVQVNGAGGAGSVVQEGTTFSPVNVTGAALSNTTGISIQSHVTNITVNSTGTASPSTQSANPPYLVLNYIIKT